jgi:NarL family two-component system sensor histidine kinase LiaS
VKHKYPEHPILTVKIVGQSILLRVIDDGVGFEAKDEHAGSYGLRNIRERIAGVGNSFAFA